MRHLPSNIQIIRKLTELNQTEFANYIGGDRITLAMQKSYESGKANPDIIYIEKLSEVSGLPTKQLMNEKIPSSIISQKVKKVENGENVPRETFLVNDSNTIYSKKKSRESDLKEEIISLLKKENGRLQKDFETSLTELLQENKVLVGVQAAMMEILIAMAAEPGKKGVYNKTVEILRRHKLEGSFL